MDEIIDRIIHLSMNTMNETQTEAVSCLTVRRVQGRISRLTSDAVHVCGLNSGLRDGPSERRHKGLVGRCTHFRSLGST